MTDNTKEIIKEFTIKKKALEKLLNGEKIKDLINKEHPLESKITELQNLRAEVIKEEFPGIKENATRLVNSGVLEKFNIPKDISDDLLNDADGHKILDMLDSLPPLQLQLVKLATGMNLDFYNSIKL